MKLYKTRLRIIVEHASAYYSLDAGWDALINREHLYDFLLQEIQRSPAVPDGLHYIQHELLAPIGGQEIWAAGVTYYRSREARMEESKSGGGADFYDKVYEAERPELFFKATAQRTAGHGDYVYIRRDSSWNVPEPELTLFINSNGAIQGYTIGNDMSSRSIEGENPLYLPQAKVYERCAGLGPCLYVPEHPIHPDTLIQMKIIRSGATIFSDSVSINKMKRKHEELVSFLFRECNFPAGCFLMTGTCLVPSNDFTLAEDDEINITIDPIGSLVNKVKKKK